MKNRNGIVSIIVYEFISVFSFWLGEEDVQRQKPLESINIMFEFDLCSWGQYSFLQKNLHQMLQYCDDYQNEQLMHFERPDY